MSRRIQFGALALMAVMAAPVLSYAKTIEEIEKDMLAALDKMKSYSATVTSATDMKQGDMNISMHMNGTYEAKKVGEKLQYRMEAKTKMNIPGMENMPGGGEQNILVVCDGDFTWQLADMMGQKNVVKTKADTAITPWGTLRDTHDLKVLDDEKVDGADCYVVEAKAKQGEQMQANRIVFYCRKDLGATVKQIAYMDDNTPANTMTFTDIKLNPDLPEEHFKFEVPAGVNVIDQTGAK
ncbi:MAG: outer membrane lipoprotein carrier protein LolA [Phycisphaerales bacterium]|nr:outer membrane lipoprotein carrier protein LolA [Phycisphaerales bacterium]